ncbi:MAG: polysaccharide biosynthesis/export family protein [Crocinitomicaceae bacterium]|nr:polysaccharide biosynthesis/export family protein [Crocinitomicaceae bacterium]
MNSRLLLATLFLGIILSSASCKSAKNVILFQELEAAADTSFVKKNYTPIFKPDDYLKIQIASESPEDATPFNVELGLITMGTNNGYYNGIPSNGGYLVDSTGTVDLPIIGELVLGGLNRMQATTLILEKLAGHLVKPTVQIQIQNFKVTVLGDVRAPGTFKIPNERITILEVLGLAGGLNITANRENVLVIRNDLNTDKTYRINLTTTEALSSPVYYLDQNDVIYIEPNKSARIGSTVWFKMSHFVISISSVVASLIIVAFT